MADCSDVEAVLVGLVSQLAYPNGTAAASVTGDKCKVYRGWPLPASLESDLAAGTVNISVFPVDGEQNVTRYSDDWHEIPVPPVTMSLTASGHTVTVSGTPRSPLNAAVIVNGSAFVYPLQAGDTLTSVATGLTSMINNLTPASNNGPVITIPGATRLAARVGSVGSLVQEIKRQKKTFRVTVWCNSPLARDAWSRVIDPGLSAQAFVTLADGTAGRLRYVRSHTDDSSQKSRLYRRDLVYSVEYGTTLVKRTAQVVVETVNITGGQDPSAPVITSFSI